MYTVDLETNKGGKSASRKYTDKNVKVAAKTWCKEGHTQGTRVPYRTSNLSFPLSKGSKMKTRARDESRYACDHDTQEKLNDKMGSAS